MKYLRIGRDNHLEAANGLSYPGNDVIIVTINNVLKIEYIDIPSKLYLIIYSIPT